MRRRFFVEKFDNGHAVMEGEAAHHLGRVLRAQPGQVYELSDGTAVWLGRIETVGRDRVDLRLTESIPAYIPQLRTTLLLSVVKFDAFEWALEKATELGVTRIVPLSAARSEKSLLAAAPKRAHRWTKILLESSQQCRRVRLPLLDPLSKPELAFAGHSEGVRILLSEAPDAKPLRNALAGVRSDTAVLAVGPEGGWAQDEFGVARTAGFQEASFGGLILRTETAVVASLAALNFALSPNEDTSLQC
jgi:16S rRNA (uracil1498-N3)-methyltransferase